MERLLGILHRIEDGLLAILLSLMIVLASSQIILRNLFEIGFSWADPMLRILVLWLGLLGALAASRDNKHISIDILSRFLPRRAQAGAQAVTHLFTAIVAGVVSYHGARFVALDLETQTVGIAGLPAWILELIIPVAFGLIALRYALLCALCSKALLFGRPTA